MYSNSIQFVSGAQCHARHGTALQVAATNTTPFLTPPNGSGLPSRQRRKIFIIRRHAVAWEGGEVTVSEGKFPHRFRNLQPCGRGKPSGR